MRRRTFTTMLAGLACAIAVSGPLLAQAQAPQGGSRKRIGPALYGAYMRGLSVKRVRRHTSLFCRSFVRP